MVNNFERLFFITKNADIILFLMDSFTEVQQEVLINHISLLANQQIQRLIRLNKYNLKRINLGVENLYATSDCIFSNIYYYRQITFFFFIAPASFYIPYLGKQIYT